MATDESGRRIDDFPPAIEPQQESLTVYTDGFRAYEPLGADDSFDREYTVYGEGEYADEDVHVNTCESHILASQKRNTHYISECCSFGSTSAANPATKQLS